MSESARPAVKICGLTRSEDARVAIDACAGYLGAVLAPGFGRSVAPETVAGFRGAYPAQLVGVFVDGSVGEVSDAAARAGLDVIQLHGDEDPGLVASLRGEGDWTVWKAVRVRGADDIRDAVERWGDVADGLLFDGFREGIKGGAGVRFPWEALESLRGALPVGLTLVVAGGLDPSNVGEAVRRLSPDVVDVSSGVESAPGIKDPARVRAFADAAHAAGRVRSGAGASGPLL